MQGTGVMRGIFSKPRRQEIVPQGVQVKEKLNLLDAQIGQTYIIKEIDTADEDMNAFLFRLGCYSGEPITVISKKRKSCIVAIKDSRYGLDNQLAEAVII